MNNNLIKNIFKILLVLIPIIIFDIVYSSLNDFENNLRILISLILTISIILFFISVIIGILIGLTFILGLFESIGYHPIEYDEEDNIFIINDPEIRKKVYENNKGFIGIKDMNIEERIKINEYQ